MSIILKVGDKEMLPVKYKIYLNNPDGHDYIFAMKNISDEEKKEINTEIEKETIEIQFEENYLLLETKKKTYMFNQPNFKKIEQRSNGKPITIGFAFMDENDKIIKDYVKFFYLE